MVYHLFKVPGPLPDFFHPLNHTTLGIQPVSSDHLSTVQRYLPAPNLPVSNSSMDPKKNKVTHASYSTSSNSCHFVNEKARKSFGHAKIHRHPISEHGFNFSPNFTRIQFHIEARGRVKFCEPPKTAVVPVVIVILC